MNQEKLFDLECRNNIKKMQQDKDLKDITKDWFIKSYPYKYSYNFKWMGRPIIQYPQDLIALQEIIWEVKPDLIIETGIAHGGSLIFYASLLELTNNNGIVLGIDIDIRKHNKEAIIKHPMSKRIHMIEGSSVDNNVIKRVKKYVEKANKVFVVLDSCHTFEHVKQEMELYSTYVTKNSYLIVLDTIVGNLPDDFFDNKPWGTTSHPQKAVEEFLLCNNEFIADKSIEQKLLISSAPNGFLKRINNK